MQRKLRKQKEQLDDQRLEQRLHEQQIKMRQEFDKEHQNAKHNNQVNGRSKSLGNLLNGKLLLSIFRTINKF